MNQVTAEALAERLCVHFGVSAPRILLCPFNEAPRRGELVTYGGYLPQEQVVVLWKHTETLLAHEVAHHVQEVLGTHWPITMEECANRWPVACEAAMAAISKAKAAYPTPEIVSEELFARIIELVYGELL